MNETTKSIYLILKREKIRFDSKIFSFSDFRNNKKNITLGGYKTIQELFDYHLVGGGIK